MEETHKLALEQQKLGEEMDSILKKVKKDGNAKKTESYVQTRLNALEKAWKTVQENHNELAELGDLQHSYWKEDYFAQLGQVYSETKDYLKTFPKREDVNLANPSILGEQNGEDKQQKSRLNRQKYMEKKLRTILADAADDLSQEHTNSYYSGVLQEIKNEWEKFVALDEEINEFEVHFLDRYFTENVQEDLRRKYLKITDPLRTKSQTKKENHPVLQAQNPVNIKLPRIQIPTFSGGYENYITFEDIFSKLVDDNPALSNTEKMYYLKTYVIGEPAKLIQHLSTVGNNYETAFQILQYRYKNSRLILSKLLDKILDQPSIQSENSEKLKQLHDTTTECLEAISNLGISTGEWGPIVGRIVTRKWDPETNKLYELSLQDPHKVQKLNDILDFLEKRFQALESIAIKPNDFKHINQTRRTYQQNCSFCKLEHVIQHCSKFRELSTSDRFNFIKEKQLCLNCMGHDFRDRCHSQFRCQQCGARHHTLLHEDSPKYTPPKNQQQGTSFQRRETGRNNFFPYNEGNNRRRHEANTSANHNTTNKPVLLATAILKVVTSSGSLQPIRALVDQGSQSSFITTDAAQTLGLPKYPIKAEISGLGSQEPRTATWKVQAALKPHFPSNFTLNTELIVLNKLTDPLPKIDFPSHMVVLEQNEIVADPTYNRVGPIDIILGANELGQILLPGITKSGNGLIAQNTEFGWIMSGQITGPTTSTIEVASMVSQVEEDKQLAKFWEIEEVSQSKSLTVEEELCEQHFVNNTTRNADGTYTVRIPFIKENVTLGNSRRRATARLLQLEKRLQKDEKLKEDYSNFMNEYLTLGHMREVPHYQQNNESYYIPHQPIIKEESTTTKLRVVYDASCKTDHNISLNDSMYAGPKLQRDLSQILLRWRKHKYVIKGDVEKMYRQIRIHPHDQQFQRILWRFDFSQPIREYELSTVTYGIKAAPFLAMRTLLQLATDEEKKYPIAAKITREEFYVDDVLTGANSIREAAEIQSELIEMMAKGGFKLRKWCSNNQLLLKDLASSVVTQHAVDVMEEEQMKSLGVLWKPSEDTFHFRVKTKLGENMTKRGVLSQIATLFDPLGWLSPIIIIAKLLMQELWRKEIPWDAQLDEKTSQDWCQFVKELVTVEEIIIPRWCCYEGETIEIHGFCDASEKAYGAVVYIRIIKNQEATVTLLQAKSKVAPSKRQLTLPKLELCAASLLAKLIQKTVEALAITEIQIFAWSDSMITLGWIKGNPSQWKSFVANRVSEIQDNVPTNHWNYVSTTDNPADLITRGVKPQKLKNNRMWWNGPDWLQQVSNLPQELETTISVIEEKSVCLVQVQEELITDRFSNLGRMQRVLAYCLRFISRARKQTANTGSLTVAEVRQSLTIAIKLTQAKHFAEEIQQLRNKRQVSKQSKLAALDPYLDEGQTIHVGGRLMHAELTLGAKNPIILPGKNLLTQLVIRNAHISTLHGGVTLTLTVLRKQYWITNAKNAVKSVVHNCTTCVRYRKQTQTQLMGHLPEARVTPSYPFLHTGLDYAGPIQCRISKGRGVKSHKAWIALFVCMATRAVHIEVVSDMTTDAFLAAFKRFIARRGKCSHVYSDNGTTFVGAAKILNKEVTNIVQRSENTLVNLGTQWKFNPPSSPHQGGLWEAAVKSLKYHLKRVLKDTTLTYEELSTLTQQIEACLNSRPLCTINDSLEYLTPAHFLIGRELLTLPATQEVETTTNQRWKFVQKLNQSLWKAWSQHYLLTLQQRFKWITREKNIKVGNVVIIKDDNISPNQWPLGRVTEVHSGKDNLTRVVTVKKADGTQLKRPVQKLITLPSTEKIEEVEAATTATCSTSNFRKHQTRTQRAGRLPCLMTTLLCVISVITSTQAGYVIHYPEKGLYIEQIGQTRSERGIFRIQVSHPKQTHNSSMVSNIIHQFSDLCNKTRDLSEETHCELLTQHLLEQQTKLKWLEQGLESDTIPRAKRGLLGQALTSIFGVNDEVYRDLDELSFNQKELIKAAQHQTKVMVSTLFSINETETRINNQLQRFTTKLNKGIEMINKMNAWYRRIDTNRLNIHILSSYQLAINIITDETTEYSKLSNIHYGKGTLYDVLSPAQVAATIIAANKKLPQHLTILREPVLSTSIISAHDKYFINGHFLIVDVTEFELIRVTPTPIKTEDKHYWTIKTTTNLLAVDYNAQNYFELAEEEFRDCETISNHQFVCNPNVIKKIETNPNCILDYLYDRLEDINTCPLKKHPLRSTIWKKLQMKNTWMFVVGKPTRVAVICDGNREDIKLSISGIIQISQECIITTKHNVLVPKRSQGASVISSYSKAVNVSMEPVHPSNLRPLQLEPVLRPEDSLSSLAKQEEDMDEELQEVPWRTISRHPVYTGVGTTAMIIVVVAALWMLVRRILKQPRSTAPQAFQMRPLRPVPPTAPFETRPLHPTPELREAARC